MADVYRRKRLARLHCLKRDLGMEDDEYRDALEQATGKRSAAQLNGAELDRALDHLAALAGQPRKHVAPGTPPNLSKRPLLKKIEAQLTSTNRPWKYADGIAKRMYGVDHVGWCNDTQLRSVIAALWKDAKRKNRSTDGES